MDYKVVITLDAEQNLEAFIRYLLFEKKSEQAAASVLDDFEVTKKIQLSKTSIFYVVSNCWGDSYCGWYLS